MAGLTTEQQQIIEAISEVFQRDNEHAETLAKLNEVGQALVSLEAAPGELERVLQRVAESAFYVLDADVVTVYQYVQEKDDFLVPPVQVGELHVRDVPKERVFRDDVVFKIVHLETPTYSEDAQKTRLLAGPFEIARPERPAERFVVREGIVSSAAVPLRARGEPIGVMFVNYRKAQSFPKEQREAIQLFASQAAVAIRNARLFELVCQQEELQRAYAALKEEQEKRIAAEKMRAIGQAAANLAHKMNNMGGIIPVCVQELREQVGGDADVQENLDIIEQQAKHLLHAANDLLRPFAWSETVKLDVNALVKEALQSTRPLLDPRIRVSPRYGKSLPRIKGTRLLGDVFIELITNAGKAMPGGGKLGIETTLTDGRQIEVSFADTGCGIPLEKQKWIFESLGGFRPETWDEDRKRPGTRFGLWWVKTFLQQWGADIDLRWSEVDKGSKFVVIYPVDR